MLRTHTCFHNYKNLEQKISVQTALRLPPGHVLLVSLPTGGGKSLVTQLTASTSDGLTIVIVPTVALAMDQYHAAMNSLKNPEGIYCYFGGQSDDQRVSILRSLKQKTCRILFTSPEAIFKNAELSRLLEQSAASGYLQNVVIDEAHVVPDWGVFFRPGFQIFAIALKNWRKTSGEKIRTFLLSATLSDDVVDTLFSLFGAEGRNIQVRCDALRQEPRFYFHSAKSRHEQCEKTIDAIIHLPKPMVVYVLEPRDAEDLQKKLQGIGFKNIPVFTGDTRDSEREKILVAWKEHQYDVIVATSAFGIGVDKSNVRTIVHACCPENLSRFYQEVGRAGRDRLPSLSVFIPHQGREDSDVNRAYNMVNKRVLTVEKTVIRWFSMLHSPTAFVSNDLCVLDTSAPPSDMSEERAEMTGQRNVSWNVNLLLFLNRTGFIDLIDACYIPEKKSYTVTAQALRPDILSNAERLAEALEQPRAAEYAAQLKGYTILRDLVASPRSVCWGHTFKTLFPLSTELCNGCPADPSGRQRTDETYRLREKPGLLIHPIDPSRRLDRHMSSYDELIVLRNSSDSLTSEELQLLATACENCGVTSMVVPRELAANIVFSGCLFDEDEFPFAARYAPYLFAGGVACAFGSVESVNRTLYKSLKALGDFSYRRVLYCSESTIVAPGRKTIRDCASCYSIPLSRF